MRLLFLETKRILKSRQTMILMAIGLILSILMAYIPIRFEEIDRLTENGSVESLSGIAAIQYFKSKRSVYDGVVTTEKIHSALEIYQFAIAQNNGDTVGVPFDTFAEKILPSRKLLSRLPEVYADPKTGIGTEIKDLQISNMGDYYDQCIQHLDDIMKIEYTKNTNAQNKAKEMYHEVKKPFELYGGLSRDAFDYIILYVLLLLLIGAAITAPTFSEEYQNGSDSIFRSCRNGRLRMAGTKLIALYLIFIVYFILCMTINLLIINLAFGTECLKTSVQMLFSAISLAPYNLGQLQIVVVAGALLSLLATMAFSLFVSSKSRTSLPATLVSVVVCYLPSILYSANGGKWISYILPSSGIGLKNSLLYQLVDFNFLNIGGISIWSPAIIIFVAIIEFLLFSFLAIRSYCKHEVV